MAISEEESIRRLTLEKNAVGNSAKWVAIVSAAYFISMLLYEQQIGVLLMSGAIFIVSTIIWLKKRHKVKSYLQTLAKLNENNKAS